VEGEAGCWPTRKDCLGEDHATCRAQALDDERIALRDCSASASEPALVRNASAVSMLSLDETGTPCSGPRGPLVAALAVERFRNGERIGIALDHGVDSQAPARSIRVHPSQVVLWQSTPRFARRIA
jgi:hypothetical protein